MTVSEARDAVMAAARVLAVAEGSGASTEREEADLRDELDAFEEAVRKDERGEGY